jgi:hypothetical protein
MERRERWFADGAAALLRTLSGTGMADLLPDGLFYACPLCLIAYGHEAFTRGALSDEHVPPRSTGGRVLLLTCTSCNSTAGSTIDAPAAAQEAAHDFLAGRSVRRELRAEYKVGDVTVRGSVNSAMMMFVVPKANNPSDVTEMTRTLTKWADEGVGGRIGFRFRERLSPQAARLSWVRAGYLAAFAALGWRYALLECLNPLRAQLAAPEESILPPLSFFDAAASPNRRQMLIVEEPAEMRSLAVALGRHTVFLPCPVESRSLDEISAGLAWYSEQPISRRRCTRKQVPWPAEPQYALDQ